MKEIGYCGNSMCTRKRDFTSIMHRFISRLSECASEEIRWAAAILPLKLYMLFSDELLNKGSVLQIRKAISYIIEDALLLNAVCPLKKITALSGLLSYFPNGKEKILLDHICSLPGKIAANPLFFASKNNRDIYLSTIEELLDALESANNQKSWLDRLDILVATREAA